MPKLAATVLALSLSGCTMVNVPRPTPVSTAVSELGAQACALSIRVDEEYVAAGRNLAGVPASEYLRKMCRELTFVASQPIATRQQADSVTDELVDLAKYIHQPLQEIEINLGLATTPVQSITGITIYGAASRRMNWSVWNMVNAYYRFVERIQLHQEQQSITF